MQHKHVQQKEALCFHLLTTESSWLVFQTVLTNSLRGGFLNKVTECQTLHFTPVFQFEKDMWLIRATSTQEVPLYVWTDGQQELLIRPVITPPFCLNDCWSHASGFNYGQDSCVYCVSEQFLHLLMLYLLQPAGPSHLSWNPSPHRCLGLLLIQYAV